MTFHEYPKIKRFGDRNTQLLLEDPNDIIYIEEKIDGAQGRFMIVDSDRIVFGSHHTSIGDTAQEIGGSFKHCVSYILDILKDKNLSKYVGYIFYGEYCIPHSINYNWDVMLPFIGYDIMKDDKFVSYEEKCNIFKELGFEVVKSYPAWTAEYILNKTLCEDDIPKSEYGDIKAEGIVLKNYRTQTFIKHVSEHFKEVHKSKFGENKKFCKTDDERFIATYCTNARIDKHIFKLVYDGNELDMPLMQYLPKFIWEDIIEENAIDILNENWVLDLRQCRKSVAKRCVDVLKQVISRQYVSSNAEVKVNDES